MPIACPDVGVRFEVRSVNQSIPNFGSPYELAHTHVNRCRIETGKRQRSSVGQSYPEQIAVEQEATETRLRCAQDSKVEVLKKIPGAGVNAGVPPKRANRSMRSGEPDVRAYIPVPTIVVRNRGRCACIVRNRGRCACRVCALRLCWCL